MRAFLFVPLSVALVAGSGAAWGQPAPTSPSSTNNQSPSSQPSRTHTHKPGTPPAGSKQGDNLPHTKTPPSPSSLNVSRGEHEADRMLTPPILKPDNSPQ